MAEEGDLFSFSIVRNDGKAGRRPRKTILKPYILPVGHSCTFAGAYEELVSLCGQQFEEESESGVLPIFEEKLCFAEKPRCFVSSSLVESVRRNEVSLNINVKRCELKCSRSTTLCSK